MYEITSNETTYKVPLDKLDLSYLHRHFDNGSAKSMPLWSLPIGEQYYKFKLNAWRVPASGHEDETTDDLSYDTQLCHICNTHVPLQYINEHKNSITHTNMKKIQDLILRRGKKSLNCNAVTSKSDANYYCDDCSIVVSKSKKEKHESSYTHKISLRNKDLIEEFLKFYSKDLYDVNVKKTLLYQEYYNKFVNRKNLSYKIEIVDDAFLSVIIKGKHLKIDADKYHGFMKTDVELICALCEVQFRAVIEIIKTHVEGKKHRKKIACDMHDEHCIREINDLIAHCVLCNELIPRARIAGHKVLISHLVKLYRAQGKKDIEDFNKNYVITGDNMFRNLTDEVTDHVGNISESSSQEYKEEVGNSGNWAMVQNENLTFDNTSYINQTYCNVCSVYIDTHNFKSHTMGNIHKQLQSSKCKVDKKNLVKIKNIIYKDLDAVHGDNVQFTASNVLSDATNVVEKRDVKVIDTNKIRTDLKNEITKPVSENNVQNSDLASELKEASTSNTNMVKIDKSTSDSSIEKFDLRNVNDKISKPVPNNYTEVSETESIEIPSDFMENIKYLLLETIIEKEIICKVCNLLTSNTGTNVYNHINGENHTSRYNELLRTNKLTKAQNKFFCHLCKLLVTSKNEIAHIFGNKHRNKFPNNGNNSAPLYCEFCKIHTADSVQEHQNSKIHKFSTKENTTNTSHDSCIQSANDKSDQRLAEAKANNESLAKIDIVQADFLKLHYHFTKTANLTGALCKICNVAISNSMGSIDTHINGYKHRNKYAILLKSNRVIERDDKQFYCEVCDVSFFSKNEIEHIMGLKHKRKIQEEADRNNVHDTENLEYFNTNGEDEEEVEYSDEEEFEYSDEEEVEYSDEEEFEYSDEEEVEYSDEEEFEYSDEEEVEYSDEEEFEYSDEEEVEYSDEEEFEYSDEEEVEVYEQRYYQVAVTSHTEVLCKICNVVLPNFIFNIETHVLGISHRERYKILLESNKIVKMRDKTFHCGICDVVIKSKNEIQHLMGFNHVSRLQEETDKNYVHDSEVEYSDEDVEYYENLGHAKSQSTATETTKDRVSFDKNNAASSVPATAQTFDAGNTQDENFQTSSVPKSDNTQSNANIKEKRHYHVTVTSNTEVLCKICNVVLTNSNVNIETHVLGINHREKYKRLLESNKIAEMNDKTYHCDICDAVISSKNEIGHLNGLRHKTNLRNYSEVQNKVGNSEDVEYSDEEEVEYYENLGHAKSQSTATETTKDRVFFDKNNAASSVPATAQTLHARNTQDENFQTSSVPKSDKTQSNTNIKEKRHHHVTVKSNTEVLCKICNVVLTNSNVNIETHVLGINHREKYKILLESNKIVEMNDNTYHCDICDAVISYKNEIQHLNGSRHKTNLRNISEVRCEICDITLPSYALERHRRSPGHFLKNLERFGFRTLGF